MQADSKSILYDEEVQKIFSQNNRKLLVTSIGVMTLLIILLMIFLGAFKFKKIIHFSGSVYTNHYVNGNFKNKNPFTFVFKNGSFDSIQKPLISSNYLKDTTHFVDEIFIVFTIMHNDNLKNLLSEAKIHFDSDPLSELGELNIKRVVQNDKTVLITLRINKQEFKQISEMSLFNVKSNFSLTLRGVSFFKYIISSS